MQVTINKNESKTKEDKKKDIKSKTEYSQLLFKESRLNMVEMQYHSKRNKLIMQKNFIEENIMMSNWYYNLVITL